jgi:Protein of unknown function (DUF3710)
VARHHDPEAARNGSPVAGLALDHPTPGGPLEGGPYDGDSADAEIADAPGTVDFGAIRVPLPAIGTATVEPPGAGGTHALHVALPQGRLSVSALAAPKSSRLWPELAKEIEVSLREGGARVRSFPGDWGRELHATTGAATSVFVGIDGVRWMLYGVATGPTTAAVTLDAELRRMLRGTVVVRGRSPYPVRTVLPLSLPEHLKPVEPDPPVTSVLPVVEPPAAGPAGPVPVHDTQEPLSPVLPEKPSAPPAGWPDPTAPRPAELPWTAVENPSRTPVAPPPAAPPPPGPQPLVAQLPASRPPGLQPTGRQLPAQWPDQRHPDRRTPAEWPRVQRPAGQQPAAAPLPEPEAPVPPLMPAATPPHGASAPVGGAGGGSHRRRHADEVAATPPYAPVVEKRPAPESAGPTQVDRGRRVDRPGTYFEEAPTTPLPVVPPRSPRPPVRSEPIGSSWATDDVRTGPLPVVRPESRPVGSAVRDTPAAPVAQWGLAAGPVTSGDESGEADHHRHGPAPATGVSGAPTQYRHLSTAPAEHQDVPAPAGGRHPSRHPAAHLDGSGEPGAGHEVRAVHRDAPVPSRGRYSPMGPVGRRDGPVEPEAGQHAAAVHRDAPVPSRGRYSPTGRAGRRAGSRAVPATGQDGRESPPTRHGSSETPASHRRSPASGVPWLMAADPEPGGSYPAAAEPPERVPAPERTPTPEPASSAELPRRSRPLAPSAQQRPVITDSTDGAAAADAGTPDVVPAADQDGPDLLPEGGSRRRPPAHAAPADPAPDPAPDRDSGWPYSSSEQPDSSSEGPVAAPSDDEPGQSDDGDVTSFGWPYNPPPGGRAGRRTRARPPAVEPGHLDPAGWPYADADADADARSDPAARSDAPSGASPVEFGPFDSERSTNPGATAAVAGEPVACDGPDTALPVLTSSNDPLEAIGIRRIPQSPDAGREPEQVLNRTTPAAAARMDADDPGRPRASGRHATPDEADGEPRLARHPAPEPEPLVGRHHRPT